MKRILYYIPFIVFGLFYALILFSGSNSVSPIVWLWLALFLISGILMGKNIALGAIVGVLPAAHIIYMGTKDTGQIINETLIGVIVFVFYAVCFYICSKSKKVLIFI